MAQNKKTRPILGRKVRALRRLRRWTQAELAQRAGLAERTIHNIEAGEYEPLPATLRALDEVFGQQVETVVLDEAI